MKRLPLVCVIWDDTCTIDPDTTWVDRGDAASPKPYVFHSVGFITEVTPDAVVLSHCVGKELMAPRDRIPRGAILQILRFDPARGVPMTLPRRKKTA